MDERPNRTGGQKEGKAWPGLRGRIIPGSPASSRVKFTSQPYWQICAFMMRTQHALPFQSTIPFMEQLPAPKHIAWYTIPTFCPAWFQLYVLLTWGKIRHPSLTALSICPVLLCAIWLGKLCAHMPWPAQEGGVQPWCLIEYNQWQRASGYLYGWSGLVTFSLSIMVSHWVQSMVKNLWLNTGWSNLGTFIPGVSMSAIGVQVLWLLIWLIWLSDL